MVLEHIDCEVKFSDEERKLLRTVADTNCDNIDCDKCPFNKLDSSTTGTTCILLYLASLT